MVKWKRLGDVCKVLRGKRLTKSQLNESEGYPVLHGGSTPMGYYNESNRKANTTVVVNTGNAGSVFFYDKEFWSSDACFSLYPNKEINDKFLYLYVYGCERILKGKIRVGAMPTIDAKAVEDLQIPIPSLLEQSRIVSILDTFTASIENLKEQIAERRKQYEYERDELLDLEGKEGVEMKKLGEVCDFIRGPFGGALKKDIFVKSGYAIYEQQHAIYGQWNFRYFIDEAKFNQMRRFEVYAGDILMSCSGTMGKTSIVPEDYKRGIINQALLKLTVKKGVCNTFIKMFMDSRWFQEGLKKKTSGGAIQNVASVSILKELEIHIPSLEEQSRIVSILDTFEASIANLEAQLELRQKQYEYYRNQLLTFE